MSHIFDSSIRKLVIFYLKNPSQRLHDKYKDFEDTEEVSIRPLRTILLNCLERHVFSLAHECTNQKMILESFSSDIKPCERITPVPPIQ